MEATRLSGREAIDVAKQHLMQYGDGPAYTVDTIWRTLKPRLSEEAKDWLMREGLRDRLTDAIHNVRYLNAPSVSSSIQVDVSVESMRQTKDIFVEIVYSFGQFVKPLGEFTETDCYQVATWMKREAAGKLAVAAFMEEAAHQLKTAMVATINALPPSVQNRLRGEWPLREKKH